MRSQLASAFVTALFLPVAASATPSQEGADAAPRPEIRGVLLEPAVESPVSEAAATLEFSGEKRLAQSKPQVTLTTKADTLGAFVR